MKRLTQPPDNQVIAVAHFGGCKSQSFTVNYSMNWNERISCIYRIVNPEGGTYIGKTVDYYFRIKRHQNSMSKGHPKLQSSIKKFGVENHRYEMITPCDPEMLNDNERDQIERRLKNEDK